MGKRTAHTVFRSTFSQDLLGESRVEPGYKRDVCDARVTSHPFVFTIFNTQNTNIEFASWRLQSFAKDEAMECSD